MEILVRPRIRTLRGVARAGADACHGSQEICGRDQYQDPESRGRGHNLPAAAASRPPLSGFAVWKIADLPASGRQPEYLWRIEGDEDVSR
jgi:hypothetical protein